MFKPKVPKWVQKHNFDYKSYDDVPAEVFDRIRDGLSKKKSDRPDVSIVAITYNESVNVLRLLSSLADLRSGLELEVIVVNNNSTDDTQKFLDRVGAVSVFEQRQGIPWARQAGLDKAKGTYHLCADGDTIYPPKYADTMYKALQKKNVVCAYGMGSFLPDKSKTRFQLAVYEFFKDLVIHLRSINRPEQSVRSQSMGFPTELAKKIGWNTGVKRGSDGRLAWALSKHGKLVLVNSNGARIWTTTETLNRDGSLGQVIGKRIRREWNRLGEYFQKQKGEYKEVEDIEKNKREVEEKLKKEKERNN
ncbi:MAG: glycosyltransferase family 2 protein [Bacteroidota bacterium]